MADPTGLISLGLGVAKKAAKHGSTVRSRQRHLKELRFAVDLASTILHNATQSDDPVARDAHEVVLGPCISEARQFLRRVEDRKWFASTINKLASAGNDNSESKRLLSALEGAPARIEAHITDLRVSLTHTMQHTNHNELLQRFAKQESDLRSMHSDVARCLTITIVTVFFWENGSQRDFFPGPPGGVASVTRR